MIGCEKDSIVHNEELEPRVIVDTPGDLSEATKVLSGQELDNISNVEDGYITFQEAMDLNKGDIIIGGISNETPGGILRKVDSAFSDNKKVLTSPASLEEVIINGSIRSRGKLSHENLEEKSAIKSGTLYDFEYPIEKQVIYDMDGDNSTTNDQISIEGEIQFGIDYDFGAEFDKGLSYAEFGTSIKQSSSLEITGNIEKEFEKDILLMKNNFAPIIIPAAGVPLVLRPRLEIHAGAVGEIEGNAYAEAGNEMTTSMKLVYDGSSWKIEKDFYKKFEVDSVDAEVNAEAKVYVTPKLELIVNEILGPFASAEGYLKLDVKTRAAPWWELHGGYNIDGGIDMGLLSFAIKDYEKRFVEHDEVITQADGGKPTIKAEYSNNDGSCESEEIFYGIRPNVFPMAEIYSLITYVDIEKNPFMINEFQIYVTDTSTISSPLEVRLYDGNPGEVSSKYLRSISTNTFESPGWKSFELENPIEMKGDKVYFQMIDAIYTTNPTQNKNIHGWGIGIDSDNSGQSYRNHWGIDGDMYVITMPGGVNGEAMMRVKGYSEQ